jgi:two-component system, NarL family, response regulator DegU
VAIKTIIVDDHPVVRFGVKQMLAASDNIEVVAEMDDVDDLIRTLQETGAEIVLLDLELERTGGIDALRLVRQNAPDAKVIIYTSHDEEDRIVQAAELGVDGYLLKGCGQRELVNAIESVSTGGIALESTVAGKLMKHMNRRSSESKEEKIRFSKRETQVLDLMASGKTNRDIGEALFISESTVKFHVHAILNKLDANNRTEAASIAAQLGLVDLT